MATNAAANIGTAMTSGSRHRDVGTRMRTRLLIHPSPFLPDGRDALTHADAHGRQAVLRVAVLHLAHQRSDQPRAAAPQWMAQRDGAAVHVDALVVEAEQAHASERLRCERLIELDHLHVARLEAGLLQGLEGRWHRPDTHVVGVNAGGGRGDESRERLDAAAPSFKGDELPAVTEPLSAKAARSFASASSDVSARGPSSSASRSASPFFCGTSTGTISSASRPDFCAASARWWLRNANASWSSRETSYFWATRSAVSPICSVPYIAAIFGLTSRQPNAVS